VAENDIPSKALVPSGGGPRYAVGDAVRVRAGTIDPDFPDIPLDGWAGVIAECDETSPSLYLVRWTAETLSRLTPAYRVRCDRDDMDADETWLLGKDLEPDPGGPLAIIAPQKLRPRALDRNDSEDRVRAIFGLTSDDPLPAVDAASLRRFHEHFTKNLSLPQPARFDHARANDLLMIQRLLPLDDETVEEGLLVEVVQADGVDSVPLADLSLWTDDDIGEDVEAYGEWFLESVEVAPQPGGYLQYLGKLPSLQMILGRILLACILIGALFGAILWSHEFAVPLAQGGGLLFGLLGLLIGARSEAALRRTLLRPPGFLIGLMLGSMLGLVVGAVGAVLLLGFLGAIPGAILGSLLGQLLSACGVRRPPTFRLTLLGAYLGAGVDAYLRSADEAIAGGVRGAVGGIGVFLVGYALMRWVMSRLPRPRL
jgi:hypothetical protein